MIYFRPTTLLFSCATRFGKLFCRTDLRVGKQISKVVAVVASIAMRSEKQIHFAALDGR